MCGGGGGERHACGQRTRNAGTAVAIQENERRKEREERRERVEREKTGERGEERDREKKEREVHWYY